MTRFAAVVVFLAVAFVASAVAPGLIYSPVPVKVIVAGCLVLCFFAARAAVRKWRTSP